MTVTSGTRLGPYEVVSPLGAGGMGEVYRARDTRLGREVALKVLPESLASDRDRLARFEQEARAASALNHPHIVTIYEVGRDRDVAFIAMELVDGRTLRELTASGEMPVRRLLAIAAQIAEGLAKAHSAGIVHRDLKPENVMISKDGFVKILDFGLAKLIEAGSGELSAMPTLANPETRPGTVMGTVGYMSPEQASGESLDYRSDQFSLGSILYEMATGVKPFQRRTAAETMSAIIREEPEPISKHRPDLPPPVRWILERCLAKDREERYASTRDLARDLSGVRDHISEVSGAAEALSAAPRGRGRRVAEGVAFAIAGALATLAIVRALPKKPPAAPSFHRLTFRRGGLGNARFAPDGRTILYGALWEGEERTQLYLTRPESPESRRFDLPSSDILSVSPSGELAVLLYTSPALGTLARLPMEGGVPRKVLEGVPYAGADWAPDGKELAVIHEVEGKTRLEFPIGKVLLEAQGGRLEAPRFSPRGERIAFWELSNQSFLNVVDAQGKARRRVGPAWALVAGVPCWRPGEKEIWFTASETAQGGALWAIDLSGNRRLVLRVPGDLELDDISRDGRVLVAHHTVLHSLMGLAPGETKERELSWLDASYPSDLSADGKTLVLTERGEGSGRTPAVYVRGTDGSPAVRLGEGLGLALSPDGNWVLAASPPAEGRPAFLTLLPTGPGQARTLKNTGLTGLDRGAFLPDGKRIVLSALAPDRIRHLYVQEVPDGQPRPIGPEGFRLFESASSVSPDGRFVVGWKPGQVLILSIDGGQTRQVPGLGESDRVVQWTADGRSLYVFRAVREPTVWLVDIESGKRRVWRELPVGEGLFRRPRITPDGKAYVQETIRALSELYVVEGLR